MEVASLVCLLATWLLRPAHVVVGRLGSFQQLQRIGQSQVSTRRRLDSFGLGGVLVLEVQQEVLAFHDATTYSTSVAVRHHALGQSGSHIACLLVFEVFNQSLLCFHPLLDLKDCNG